MKKNFVRIFSLLLCALMLLGMAPNANAVSLPGKRMAQMETITYDEDWQAHLVTEIADVQQVAWAAANDPDNYYDCIFESEETIVISQNIEIPNNMSLNIWGSAVIPAGVTVTVRGYMYSSALTVQGSLIVAEEGYVSAGYEFTITGAVDLYGTLSISDYDTVIGADRIYYGDTGLVTIDCSFSNAAELQAIAEMASAAVLPWRYIASPSKDSIFIATPVELPGNVTLQLYYEEMSMTGAPITVYGGMYIDTMGTCLIENDLILNCDSSFWSYDGGQVIFGGNVTNNGYMDIYAPITFKKAVTNLWAMDVWYDYDGSLKFEKPELYADMDEANAGYIYVNSEAGVFPYASLAGLNVDNFDYIDYYTDAYMPYWIFSGYQTVPQQPVHTHTIVYDAAVAPTCMTTGATQGSHCSDCGEVIVKQEVLPPLGHDYGLGEDGNPDFWDTTCDVCGAARVVDPTRPTHSMYRMFNPNTGEHFYTGSMEERKMLEAAGWKYEGVGFTFPASTGLPVYRLFQPSTGEHLYTMDEAEKETLMAQGWNMEGVAFNSGNENEVPQYRLYNPNVTVGAYHFTASLEERDALLAVGWQDQGIGFYTCWQ